MLKKTTVILLVMILTITPFSYAENETNDNASTNEIRPLTLQEQRDQVKEELEKASSQLTYVENELSKDVIEISKMEDEIAGFEAELKKINEQYRSIQARVAQAEKELEQVQKDYEKTKAIMDLRLVAMYKSNNANYIEILLDANNFIDVIYNYYLIEKVIEEDNNTIDRFQKQQKQIEELTASLAKDKGDMKVLKDNAEKQAVILTNNKIKLENHKQSLADTEQDLLLKIEDYRKQQQEINSLINYTISTSLYELQYSGGVMIWPTLPQFYITSGFGSRVHPIQGIVKTHNGIDIGGYEGAPEYAAEDGIVIYSGWMSGYGNTIMVDHGVDFRGIKVVTLYGHGSKTIKQVGDVVKKGDIVMEMGSTGNSTGDHLHFEVRENGIPVEPRNYLSADGIARMKKEAEEKNKQNNNQNGANTTNINN